MALIITGILFVLGMIFKKSKSIYKIEWVWIWVLLSFCNNTDRPDYQNYVKGYYKFGNEQGISMKNSEIGYKLLSKLLYHINLDFEQALAVMMLIVIVLLAVSIPKYTELISFVSSLFMLYPLVMSAIQIRNTFVMAIIVFGVRFLLEGKKWSFVKFGICVAIATTFQTTAIIYLVLLLIPFVSRKNIKYFAVVFLGLMFFLPKIDIPLLRSLFGEGRYEAKIFWVKNTATEMIFAGGWQLSCVLLLVFLQYIVQKNIKEIQEDQYYFRVNDTFIKINIILLMIIPLYQIDFSTERLFRNTIILNYIMVGNTMQFLKGKEKKAQIVTLGSLFLWYIFSTVFFGGVYADNWNTTTYGYLWENDVLQNPSNYILGWFLFITWGIGVFIFEIKNVRIVVKKNFRKKVKV